jgi:hypothetical protein
MVKHSTHRGQYFVAAVHERQCADAGESLSHPQFTFVQPEQYAAD